MTTKESVKKIASAFHPDRHLPWVLGLVLLNLFFFYDVLLTDKTYFIRDVANFHFPLKKLVTEAYAHGQWPLWNPYIQLGQPLLANPNSMAFYPTQFLFAFLPFIKAFNLHFVLHCFLAGLGTFYLARRLKFSCLAAFLAAAIFNFNGVTLSFLNVFNILPVVAFLPWLALVFVRLMEMPNFRNTALCSFLLACFFLLLEPISSLTVALFLLVFLSGYYFWEVQGRVSVKRILGGMTVAGVSALLLSAIQILPALELVRRSGRNGGIGFQTVTFWSMHPAQLLQVLLPGIFGGQFKLAGGGNQFWAEAIYENREPYLLSLYLGILPLTLALLALIWRRKKWLVWTLAGIITICLLLAMGKYTPLYSVLYHYGLIFGFGRYPVKYVAGAAFAVALLAGAGLDELAGFRLAPSRSGKTAVGMLAGMLFLLLMIVLAFHFTDALGGLGLAKTAAGDYALQIAGKQALIAHSLIAEALWHAAIFLALSLLLLGAGFSRQIRLPILRSLVALVIVADLIINNLAINPIVQSNFYDPAPAALFVADETRQNGTARIFRVNEEEEPTPVNILGATNSLVWGAVFHKLTIFEMLAAKDHVQYSVFNAVDQLESLPSQFIVRELKQVSDFEAKLRFLGGLNVRYFLCFHAIKSPQLVLARQFEINSDHPLYVYRLVSRLPRAFLIKADFVETSQFTYRDYLSSQKPGLAGGNAKAAQNKPPSPVAILNYTPNHIQLRARADEPLLLVLLDSYYPGWVARIDGVETKIRSINYVFRGVDFPPGEHEVTFSYEPPSFRIGSWITLLTLGGWLGGSLLLFWRRQRSASMTRC